MLAGLIFCIGAVKHGTPTEKKNKELAEQAQNELKQSQNEPSIFEIEVIRCYQIRKVPFFWFLKC